MITVTFTDGHATHTVHTKREVLVLINRYFEKHTNSEVNIGDKVRILTTGGFDNGEKYIGKIYEVEAVYGSGVVGLRTGLAGSSELWIYYSDEYELVKE